MKIYRIAKIPQSFIRAEDQEYLNVVPGEAGTGIYFSPETNQSMVDHYTETTKHIVRATPKSSANIIDLTVPDIYQNFMIFANQRIEELSKSMQYYVKPKISRSNFQRFGSTIEDFLHQYFPNNDGYLVPHMGPGIPTGKQLVMTNEDAFIIEWLS